MSAKNITAIFVFLALAATCGTASAWLSGYDHRMAITTNNGGASTLNYYQFNFTNDTNVLVAAGHMQATGADCRVTNASDNLIPFWNETAFNVTNTTIWANATTLPVGDNTFYMYYGNAGASSVANITTTFDFGDDFSTNTLTRVDDPSNPTRTADDTWEGAEVNEPSDFNYSGEYISWYRGNHAGTYEIGFENSTDGVTWTGYSGNPIISTIAVYSYVVQDGDCFYMFVKRYAEGAGGKIYLYNVTDYTNPTIMNGGAAVLQASQGWESNTIFNTGVEIDGNGVWHMLYESLGENVGYTYSNLTEMNWTMHKSANNPIFTDAGNPYLKYVPDRNALLVLMGYRPSTYWAIRAWSVSLSTDLNIAANWTMASDFEISYSSIHAADPHGMFNFNATYPTMISYNYNQASIYQCYYATTLNEFYDGVVTGALSEWDSHETATYAVSDGILTTTVPASGTGVLKAKTNHSMPHIIEWRSKAAGDTIARTGFSTDITTTSANQVGFWWAHDSSRSYVATYTGSSGGITQLSPAMDTLNYHNYKIKWVSASLANYYCDDNYKAARTSNISTTDLSAWILVYGCPTYIGHWDWVFVRKYTATEPTTTLGAEEDAPSGDNDITLAANKYGLLRKNVTSSETFSTIASGFTHDVCYTWFNNASDGWESYWVGDTYNADKSIPQNDSYFVLMDGTGETVSCGVASAGTVAIPSDWSMTYLRESTSYNLTTIKADMGANVTDLYAWNHTASGTGAWIATGTYSVLPNQGLLVNSSQSFNWDGSI